MIEIVNNYIELKKNIGNHIDESGYKSVFLAKKIGVSPVSFSRKKRNGIFTDEEIRIIVSFIFSQEAIEKENIFNALLKQAENDIDSGRTISNKEVKRFANA